MKKFSLLWILTCLAIVLFGSSACTSDTLPEPDPGKQPAPPAETLDAYHDKIRTQPYPKTDNEVTSTPPRSSYPKIRRRGNRCNSPSRAAKTSILPKPYSPNRKRGACSIRTN